MRAVNRGTNQRAEPRHLSPSAIKFETLQIEFEKQTAELCPPRSRKGVPGPLQLDPTIPNQPSVNAACGDGFGILSHFRDGQGIEGFFPRRRKPAPDISVYPRNELRGSANKDTYELFD